jgi:hypothetical protein
MFGLSASPSRPLTLSPFHILLLSALSALKYRNHVAFAGLILLHMRSLITLIIATAFVAAPLAVKAADPAPTPSPAASPAESPAKAKKARGKKAAATEASPATSPEASPAASPAAKKQRGKKAATTEASPAAAAAAAPAAAPAKAKGKAPAPQAQQAPGGGNGQVWVNSDTNVYHKEGSRWYGRTKHGKYMSEADAQKAGAHAAKDEKQ